ncbi:hypothetical protein J6590_042681 [Homalodisca vitripennis]|nr:hypothetical protein J6590_042681 [Homalodisca vitripennis]
MRRGARVATRAIYSGKAADKWSSRPTAHIMYDPCEKQMSAGATSLAPCHPAPLDPSGNKLSGVHSAATGLYGLGPENEAKGRPSVHRPLIVMHYVVRTARPGMCHPVGSFSSASKKQTAASVAGRRVKGRLGGRHGVDARPGPSHIQAQLALSSRQSALRLANIACATRPGGVPVSVSDPAQSDLHQRYRPWPALPPDKVTGESSNSRGHDAKRNIWKKKIFGNLEMLLKRKHY